ncbi:hypothetical protein Pmi06nite_41510 [Planotetraspora mira]|uniref:Uncharacterized protein n=1 Tax=Planotetraspora mira TaxID=58121 RepID=A0A8J3X879_9ACTN|nr:hypothetical protein Pmi06nite_41510 [Planotetraspora mira]
MDMRIFNKLFTKPSRPSLSEVSYLEALATNARHSRTGRPTAAR